MFDSTIGGNAATSYLSVADAIAILQSLPQSGGVTAWLALTEQQQQQSLTGATMVLDPLNWKGAVCSCEQRLSWPRQLAGCGCPVSSCGAIPFDIQLACAYLASDVGAAGGGYVGSAGSTGGASGGLEDYSKVTIGPITVEMKPDAANTSSGSNFDRLPAFVADLLKTYLHGTGGLSQVCLTRGSTVGLRRGLSPAHAWSGTMQFGWTQDGRRVVMPRPENGTWVGFQSETSQGGVL